MSESPLTELVVVRHWPDYVLRDEGGKAVSAWPAVNWKVAKRGFFNAYRYFATTYGSHRQELATLCCLTLVFLDTWRWYR